MTATPRPQLPPDHWYDRPKTQTQEIIDRLVRIETRLVKLMIANGLDADGARTDTIPG